MSFDANRCLHDATQRFEDGSSLCVLCGKRWKPVPPEAAPPRATPPEWEPMPVPDSMLAPGEPTPMTESRFAELWADADDGALDRQRGMELVRELARLRASDAALREAATRVLAVRDSIPVSAGIDAIRAYIAEHHEAQAALRAALTEPGP